MTEVRVIERFKKRTIWFHWVHTGAFLILVITGAILFIPGLGGVATGGLTRTIHRIAVLFFAGAPLVYFAVNPKRSLNFIKETLDAVGTGPRFILGISDTTPPDADFGRLVKIRDMINSWS